MFARKSIAFLCLLAAVTWVIGPISGVSAQSGDKGTVSGYVYDVRSGDVVRQVNVTVVDNGAAVTTGVDGDYLLELPPGTYTLEFSKDGYLDYTVEGVVIEADGLADQGAALTPVGYGEEVTVTAGGGDVIGQLDDRKYGAVLQDSISRKEISQDVSSSAAGVVARVVGITVNSDDTVLVRGLGDRYSKTVMNDAIFPTTEPDRQAVPLNLVPANLLQNIKVFKTFTPDQPGEFSGGLVRLETVDLPSKSSLEVSYSISFNSETQGEDFLTYPGGNRDWFGLGSRSRALPGGIPENERVFRGNPFLPGGFTPQQLETLGESFNNVWSPVTESARPSNSFSLSYGDRFGKLGFVAAFGYKNELQTLDEIRRFYSVGLDDQIELFTNYDDYTASRRFVRWGSTLNTTYELTGNNRIYWKNFFTNQATDEARIFEGFNNDRATELRNLRLRYTQEKIFTTQPSGSHILPWLGNTLFTWRYTYSRATLDEPDLRESLYEFNEFLGEFVFFNQTQSLFRLFNEMRENIREPAFDLLKTWTLGGATINGKAGASFINRDRVFDSRRFRFRPRSTFGIDTSLAPEQLLSPEFIDPDRGFELAEETRPTDHYDAFHDIYAIYAMGDVALNRWRVVGGVRMEDSDQAVNTFDPFRAGEPTQARLQDRDYLPSISLAYQLVPDKMVLRGSFSRTVARPQFRELSPFEFTDVTGGFSVVGNPDISRTLIANYDGRFEWFLNPGEIVAVSVFYKDLEDPIEPVIEPTAQLRKSFRNAEGAKNRGYEIELRKNLGFAGSWLSPVSLNFNYTYVDSTVDIGQQDLSVLTTLERPLVGQSENVVNAVLVYDLAKYDFETRAYFNYTGDRITDVGAQGLPDIVEQGYPTLDFAFTKRFGTGDRKPWKVELQLENMLNRRREFRQGGLPFQVYRPGREFGVEVGYSFF